MRCRNLTTGETFAVKVLEHESHNKQTEIEALRLCQGHPNVVRLVEVLEDDLFTYIVTELLEGGELNDRTARMSADQLNYVFLQIFDAVDFIHSKGVAHRDLKPENIVFESATSNQVRIVDFGFAKKLSDVEGMNYLEYTLDYASPEALHCNTMGGMSKASDYWSIGAIMYRSVCGRLPFGEGDGVKERIREASFDQEVAAWKRAPLEVRQIVEGLLWPVAEDRFNADTIPTTIWYRQCTQRDALKEDASPAVLMEVEVIPMPQDVEEGEGEVVVGEEPEEAEEEAVLVENDVIEDELELPLKMEDEETTFAPAPPIVEMLEPPEETLSHSGATSETIECGLDAEEEPGFVNMQQPKSGDEDASSLHSMSSGDAAPIDDITTMELFNNNEKFVHEQDPTEDEEPPVLNDERDRIMEEIHCEVEISVETEEHDLTITDKESIPIRISFEREFVSVDSDDEEDFLGFDLNFTRTGRICDPYLRFENRRIRQMVSDLKHDISVLKMQKTPPRSKMIRCDYKPHSGPTRIPFRKRGHSHTMIKSRFTTASKQPPISVPTADHNTTAANNLFAVSTAAAYAPPIVSSSVLQRQTSRTSGRKRNATVRLADELIVKINPKLIKLSPTKSQQKTTTPVKVETFTTTTKTQTSIITKSESSPTNASIITNTETSIITPSEVYIITSFEPSTAAITCPPPATFCPPPSSAHRRRLKRTPSVKVERRLSSSNNNTAPSSFASVPPPIVSPTTRTRSGRRSVLPKPFVQEAFRIKVEPTH